MLWALLAACSRGPAPALSVEGPPERPALALTLPPGLAAELPEGAVEPAAGGELLRLERAGGSEQPVAGRWSRLGDTLYFEPAFALSPGTRWVARAEVGAEVQERLWSVPAPEPGPAPRVVEVRPALDVLPQNVLKLYVTFSAPMEDAPDVVDQVLLTDQEVGEPDPVAWYRHRMWSEDRRRLTLVFHPGRVKSDISFSQELGPVLTPGRRYQVTFTRGLTGADGQRLAEPYTIEFTAAEADHRRPVPEDWSLEIPEAGSTAPLVLSFDEPLEPLLAETGFALSAGGRPVAAEAIAAADGRSLRFQPAAPWAARQHSLERRGRVEDLAGNTPERTFEGPSGEVERPDPAQKVWRFTPGG